MKEFNIKITDTEVYINGRLCEFAHKMDKNNPEDDLNKKAIVALANEMNYEAVFLFEEMADRLDEMLDEIDDDDDGELEREAEECDEDDDFLQGLMDEAMAEESIQIWLEQLLEATGKSNTKELTAEEIRAEIEDVKGTISNEEIVLGISEFAEENIAHYESYLEMLEEMLKTKKEESDDN